jgi:hypothetical protein
MSDFKDPPHPYAELPPYQFWYRSVSAVEPHLIDPVTNPRFTIRQDARVATAGSCFAQHISHAISKSGFNYFVVESESGSQDEGGGYGVFSARYGNIYTTVQLLQLFEEAFGTREVEIVPWQRPDRRYIDPLRQQAEPRGFACVDTARQDRLQHLAAVRRMFLEADVFVFTLGLTEAWRLREDGTVLSAAPGVVGGRFDPALHEFVNFSVDHTSGALTAFLEHLHAVNPACKVLLTVSPVPLIATYEDKSVLLSTTYSKSVLRVAVEMATRDFDWVDYFPSYEIITGSFSRGLYYEKDRRSINTLGVAHAIRCFMRHYAEGGGRNAGPPTTAVPFGHSTGNHQRARDIVCDEEILERART